MVSFDFLGHTKASLFISVYLVTSLKFLTGALKPFDFCVHVHVKTGYLTSPHFEIPKKKKKSDQSGSRMVELTKLRVSSGDTGT